MNKGHPREIQIIVFIDKWSLLEVSLFNLFSEGFSESGLYLQDGLYS